MRPLPLLSVVRLVLTTALLATLVSAPAVVSGPADAATRRAVSITLSPRGEIYNPGNNRVTFRSTLSHGRKGATARLQIFTTSWKTVRTVTLRTTGRQTVRFSPLAIDPGRVDVRVVTSGTSTHGAGNSHASASQRTAVHRVACPTNTEYANRREGTLTVFSNPGQYATSVKWKRSNALASSARDLICTAAPGSVVRVATWSIRDDALAGSSIGVSNRVLGALDYVSRYRGVKVSFVLDVNTPKDEATVRWLKQMSQGRLSMCRQSCMSDRSYVEGQPRVGSQHSKYITVSSTTAGVPAMLATTSNLTSWQLRDYWNSSVLMWGDRPVQDIADARFDNMVRSARRGTVQPTSSFWVGAPLTKSAAAHTWVPAAGNEQVSPVSGVGVAFSPLNPKFDDPLLDRLQGATCEGVTGGSVRLATLYAADVTGVDVAKALTRLSESGCAVSVTISKPINAAAPVLTDRPSYEALRRVPGISLKCASYAHSKNYLFDTMYEGRREQTVMTGSRNLIFSGKNRSDEAMFRFTDVPAVFSAYARDFDVTRAARTSANCPSTWDAYRKAYSS